MTLSLDKENLYIPEGSRASDIVRRKLIENNGKATVYTVRGLPCKVSVSLDGTSFLCDKLKCNPPYRYEVFDAIVNFLLSRGGRAEKGNGRNHRLGEPKCDRSTIIGAIGYQYFHAKDGDSVFDPVFILAAILDWAGIVNNERGELVLTKNYQNLLFSLKDTEE